MGALAGCGCALLLAIGCADSEPIATTIESTPPTSRAAADPAIGQRTDLDSAAPGFGDAVLAELTGDEAAARASYERVLASNDVPPVIAARAALYLAQLESRSGRTRHALDLIARAITLAPADPVITEGAQTLQADVVAAAGAGEIRGPAVGTALPNVPADVAEQFAAADRLLAQWHRTHLRIVIEALTRSINDRINATAVVVSRYRAIAEGGGPARAAATYRIGSLYHDLALELAFADLPPELEKGARDLRATLRGLAIANLRRAITEYRAVGDAATTPDSELWRLAAETDLRRALDVLGAAGVRP